MTENSHDATFARGGNVLLDWMMRLPVGMQVFYGSIFAAIVTVVVGSFALALTGLDDRLFPEGDRAIEIVMERLGTLDSHIEDMRGDIREQFEGVSGQVRDNGESLAVIQSRMARQDKDLEALRLDIDDLQERMGRVEVRSGFLPRRKPVVTGE